ncbi:MAG: hypothetical protein Q7S72_01385 [Candidatus Taylorbacteria bacterium]|nr:hypothetical protein [Candidatus Taylorbacteria bacterium]
MLEKKTGIESGMAPESAPETNREQMNPEKVRNFMMAAELSLRIGDNDNAIMLYRDIGRPDLAPKRGDKKKIEAADLKVFLNIEMLMRKVVRWLTRKEQWQEQMRNKSGGDKGLLGIGAFPISDEPEYKAILKDLNGEKFDAVVARMLGTYEIELSKISGNPHEPEVSGVELAISEAKILLLSGGIVSMKDREKANPVVPKSLQSL